MLCRLQVVSGELIALCVVYVRVGWDEGVRTMSKGETAKLVIAAEHAYGEAGSPPAIPPRTPLVFEIELLDFKDAEIMRTGTNFL